ncbi:Diaminopimelate decarboxylase [hydrothermal vent metagenome]|uniref:Diaminopimelate decarboxylase n=1 Tax=hydrothermal vent metagenome TaxID=652676 RepID=A0A3B1AT90_9ZZZZ
MIRKLKNILTRAFLHRVAATDRKESARRGLDLRGLAPSHWDLSTNDAGHLEAQGCDLVSLAREYGAPLYVVDKERLARNYRAFYDAFADHYPKVVIGTSYKTNPLPRVISALHECGAYAEVISHFELWLALKLGVPGPSIIVNGPGKTREGLELAVSNQTKIINIDGLHEIEWIADLAKKYGHRQRVGVRVVTSVGWSAQFGLGIGNGDALKAFQQLCQHEQLEPCGIHVHLGTGIRNIDIYLTAIKEVLEFASVLKRDLGIDIRYFDFGGGFGVPTVREFSGVDMMMRNNDMPVRPLDTEACPNISEYGKAISRLMSQYYSLTDPDVPTLIFEPGRAITSSAQILLLEVLATKAGANGVTNIIANGGKNIAMPTGYEYHELFVASKMSAPRSGRCSVFGPLCHPGDILFKLKELPAVNAGDILAIMDAGAYFVPNQMNFSNPRSSAVMLQGDKAELIRERESFEDIISLDQLQTEASHGDSAVVNQ